MKLVLAAVLTLWAGTALAHSPLQSTYPGDGASVAAAPDAFEMVFRGKMRLTKVTLAFGDTAAQDLDLSEHTTFKSRFSLDLPVKGSGVYVIEWRGLGEDGHAQNGTRVFYVE